MATRTCPRCRIISPADAQVCDCGYDFASGAVRFVAAAAARPRGARPHDIIAWQHRYCVFMAALYVLTAAAGAFLIAFRKEGAGSRNSAEDLLIMGVLFIALGLVLAIAYGVAPTLEPAPWVWIYHLVLIAFGLTSVCCFPICIPLLIGWIRADTRQYYGRT